MRPSSTRPAFPLLFALLVVGFLLGAGGRPLRADPPPRGTVTDFTVAFGVGSDWGSGFVGEIALTNRGAARVNRWQLEFEWDRQLASIWNARVIEHTGRHYAIEGESWNSWLDPGGKITFGFTGAPGGVAAGPTGYRLTGELPAPPGGGGGGSSNGGVTIRYVTESDWGSGFVGRIDLTNRGTAPVNDWMLDFDWDRAFSSLWNARLLLRQGNHTRLGPEFYNRSIAPGATVSLGFVGAPGNVSAGPANLTLNGGGSVVLRSLQLTPADPLLPRGSTLQLAALGSYRDGSSRDLTASVDWSSLAPTVATVGNGAGSKGLVSGLVEGQATIVARDAASGVQGTAVVTVTQPAGGPPPTGRPVVMGYVETLRSGGAADIARLNYGAVDIVIHGFAVPLADGRIDVNQGNFGDYLAHGLVGEAHRRGKKILVSLGGAVGSTYFATIAASPTLRSAFATNLVDLVRTYGYDGVDVDYEFPIGAQQRREFTLLMQAVHAAVKANNLAHLVVFGVSPGYYIDSYEWDRLAACSDYALVFGYDWKNPANGPMTNPGVVQWTAENHTIEASVRGAVDFALAGGYPAKQIVVGLPFYGSNNVSWSQVRSAWAAQAPWTPHSQWMEVQINGAWWTTPEAIRLKLDVLLTPARSVLRGGATVAGVGFWEFGHESPTQPDLSQAIADWIRAH